MVTPHSRHLETPRPLPFHRLDVYAVALDLVRLAGGLHAHRGTAEVRDQLRRASSSCALNVAEASGKTGADRRRFFLIARGSACEAGAALDVLAALGALEASQHREGLHMCDRLYSMLTRLSGAGRPAADR